MEKLTPAIQSLCWFNIEMKPGYIKKYDPKTGKTSKKVEVSRIDYGVRDSLSVSDFVPEMKKQIKELPECQHEYEDLPDNYFDFNTDIPTQHKIFQAKGFIGKKLRLLTDSNIHTYTNVKGYFTVRDLIPIIIHHTQKDKSENTTKYHILNDTDAIFSGFSYYKHKDAYRVCWSS